MIRIDRKGRREERTNWLFIYLCNILRARPSSLNSSQIGTKDMLPNERATLALKLQAPIESPYQKGFSAQAVSAASSTIDPEQDEEAEERARSGAQDS